MVIKKKKEKVSVEAVKVVEKIAPAKKGKVRKLVAERNVAKMKALGYKAVDKVVDVHGRELGVRTNIGDLVLMEK